MATSVSFPAPAPQPELLAAQIGARLPQMPQAAGGDGAPALAAAVLVPLVVRSEPLLLFTRRTEGLVRHAGQVSFPGGLAEPKDNSPLQTALRETEEETGIAAGAVTMAGYLSQVRTGTGFDIQPVVGVLGPGIVLAPDPAEVSLVFEAPLAFFRDPASRACESRNGRPCTVFAWEGHEIWGATAAIIVDLVTRLGNMTL
jgi:8-oxo-dGTP pyrophosphatase MutT (NUDIX family)